MSCLPKTSRLALLLILTLLVAQAGSKRIWAQESNWQWQETYKENASNSSSSPSKPQSQSTFSGMYNRAKNAVGNFVLQKMAEAWLSKPENKAALESAFKTVADKVAKDIRSSAIQWGIDNALKPKEKPLSNEQQQARDRWTDNQQQVWNEGVSDLGNSAKTLGEMKSSFVQQIMYDPEKFGDDIHADLPRDDAELEAQRIISIGRRPDSIPPMQQIRQWRDDQLVAWRWVQKTYPHLPPTEQWPIFRGNVYLRPEQFGPNLLVHDQAPDSGPLTDLTLNGQKLNPDAAEHNKKYHKKLNYEPTEARTDLNEMYRRLDEQERRHREEIRRRLGGSKPLGDTIEYLRLSGDTGFEEVVDHVNQQAEESRQNRQWEQEQIAIWRTIQKKLGPEMSPTRRWDVFTQFVDLQPDVYGPKVMIEDLKPYDPEQAPPTNLIRKAAAQDPSLNLNYAATPTLADAAVTAPELIPTAAAAQPAVAPEPYVAAPAVAETIPTPVATAAPAQYSEPAAPERRRRYIGRRVAAAAAVGAAATRIARPRPLRGRRIGRRGGLD